MPSSFKHDPLKLDSRQIRLLRFINPQPSSPGIHLEISHHYLEDRIFRRKCPRYWALSYTWGPETPLIAISINNRSFRVRRNLWTLLSAVKFGAPRNLDEETKDEEGLRLEEMYFWVDQICIDQESTVERNHQVEMMRSIYQSAISTVIWLGPKGDLPGSDEIIRHITVKDAPIPTRLDFYNHPYWKRLWIVQEIMYSRQLIIMCGLHGILWEDFTDYYRSMTARFGQEGGRWSVYRYELWSLVEEKAAYLEAPPENPRIPTGERLRLESDERRPFEPTGSLRTVLDTFGDRGCDDPRDKIFGLQSLVTPKERIAVDYGLSREELYSLVMKRHQVDTELARQLTKGIDRNLMSLLDLMDDGSVEYDQSDG
ncbi:heterokaryon incompatibility protein-domain-containing protein [Lophiotrema nucula]|uniref:Heterokaryon incompatibility protein-domain-containing protein n=1 Tax=Lophiotrema nucula TaxID=690887 RepID=A0A6A5ZU54_9PLEO|nr:heterokaryon incompatibility protein-domain-containing protein [Lophiotrema nucula]